MEDVIKFILNGRRPQIFYKWKMTSKFLEMEDDLKNVGNGRQPQIFLYMEDDLK